jgi:GAF domain-containing protein
VPAKLAIHVPDAPVIARLLPDGAVVVLGRAGDCEVVVAHDSVSRRHAELRDDPGQGWLLTDLDSKNGVRVDGRRVAHAQLQHAQWFAVGDVFCEFEPIDAQAARHWSSRAHERRQSSHAFGLRLGASRDGEQLLANVLGGIVALAECRRGFLLTSGASGDLRVRACYAMQPDELAGSAFTGSRTAVERAMRERRPVFLSDRRDKAWLKGRASVVASGLRALACLPLEHDGRLLGVVYVDTDDAEKVFTDLDAELLTAFAQQAATTLAATDLDAMLARMETWLAVDTQTDHGGKRGPAPRWHELVDAAQGERT